MAKHSLCSCRIQSSSIMPFSYRMKGVSLIELMIASVMSVLIIIAVLTIYVNSQHSSRTQTLTRQIQENGRFAIQLIGEDIRMAKYLGLNVLPSTIESSVTDAVLDCGDADWVVNVSEPIFTENNDNPYSGTCIPTASYQLGTDVLVVRHTESEPLDVSDIKAGNVYLYTSLTDGETFRAATAATINPTTLSNIIEVPTEIYKFSTTVYYIRPFSNLDEDDGIPTLVRQTLSTNGTAIEPLIQFVENLQVSLGIDATGDNTIDRYVNPDNVSDWSAVLSARINVLIRSPEKVTGYNEAHLYQVEDGEPLKSFSDGYHRKVFAGTLFLRNPSLDTGAI